MAARTQGRNISGPSMGYDPKTIMTGEYDQRVVKHVGSKKNLDF